MVGDERVGEVANDFGGGGSHLCGLLLNGNALVKMVFRVMVMWQSLRFTLDDGMGLRW